MKETLLTTSNIDMYLLQEIIYWYELFMPYKTFIHSRGVLLAITGMHTVTDLAPGSALVITSSGDDKLVEAMHSQAVKMAWQHSITSTTP